MGILLRLGNADLLLACFGQHFPDGVCEVIIVKYHAHILKAGVILSHRDVVQLQRAHSLLGKGGLRESLGYLPAAVRTEVEADHYIAFMYTSQRMVVRVRMDDRLDKFVRNASIIARLDGC